MLTLRGAGLSKSYGVSTLFKNADFTLATGEVAGFVGANGAGKTTFLRCLLGFEEFDGGTASYDGAATVGYVEQQAALAGPTIYDDFLAAFADVRRLAAKKEAIEAYMAGRNISVIESDFHARLSALGEDELLAEYEKTLAQFEHRSGYDYEAKIRRVAYGLGWREADFQRDSRALSGGQKTRVLLARALLREPDFLFLDEPTNHLDIEMIEWLEGFLAAYRGAVLLISHDRAFLERTAGKIIELDNQTLTTYQGKYSYYVKVKAARRAALEAAYQKQQEEIKRTEEYIRRYKAGIKAKQARGRQSRLDRLERIELPPETPTFDFFSFMPPAACAERVLETENLAFSYPAGREIIHPLSLLIQRGEGVALIGANGNGKTTLLKLIAGELAPTGGRFRLGNRVKIGYFSQEHENLHPERTILEEIWRDFGLDELTSRNYLGAFLFRGDDVYKKVADLSGGEAARLAFLRLMLTGANFLLLDEPTNHLDIPAKEAVEAALLKFPGTFLVVSHDRYFLNRVTTRTLELADGKISDYNGAYDYYREKKAELAALADADGAPPTPALRREAVAANAGQKSPRREMPGNISGAGKNDGHSPIENNDGEQHPPKLAERVSTPLKGGQEKDGGDFDPDGRATPPETRGASFDPLKRGLNKKATDADIEKLAKIEAQIAMNEAELKMLERYISDPANQADPQKSAALAAEYAAKERELAERYEQWGKMMDV